MGFFLCSLGLIKIYRSINLVYHIEVKMKLTTEQKIALAKIMGWECKQSKNPENDYLYFRKEKGLVVMSVDDWNPDTNAERFRELEQAFIEKYEVDQMLVDIYNFPNKKEWTVKYYKNDGIYTISNGKGETKELASINAMLKAES